MTAKGTSSTTDSNGKELVDEAFREVIKNKVAALIAEKLGDSVYGYVDSTVWDELTVRTKRYNDRKLETLGTAPKDAEGALWTYMSSEEFMNFVEKLFQAVVGVASLGAGFTFTAILSGLDYPSGGPGSRTQAEQDRSREKVRFYLALSWLLFVCSIGWASFAALVICGSNKPRVIASLDRAHWDPRTYWFSTGAGAFKDISVLIAQLLPVAAFGTSAEAVRAYEHDVGVAAIALVALMALTVTAGWGLMVSSFKVAFPPSASSLAVYVWMFGWFCDVPATKWTSPLKSLDKVRDNYLGIEQMPSAQDPGVIHPAI